MKVVSILCHKTRTTARHKKLYRSTAATYETKKNIAIFSQL